VKRIYQIAKEFNISSKALIDLLHQMNVDAKTHMSVVPDEVLPLIKQRFDQEVNQAKKNYEKKKHFQHPTPEAAVEEPVVIGEVVIDEEEIIEEKIVRLEKVEKVDKFKKPKRFEKGRVVHPVRREQGGDEQEIKDSVKKTLAKMTQGKKIKKYKKMADDTLELEDENKVVQVPEFISSGELAKLMKVDSSLLISKALELGMMVTINQRLEMDLITVLAAEFGFDVEQQHEKELEEFDDDDSDPINYEERPPVVTIMGHVDHGKTTLLDFIRKSNITATESGGITQHIGAYQAEYLGKRITFIDTPGHEAFTAMRARGAQITDIVILIVAAEDGIKPQTEEAINHARAANVPVIVAINKIDLPGANPDRVKQQLVDHGLVIEEWGGDIISVPISAKKGTNIDKLLEMILLIAELRELKGNPKRMAIGVIVEAKLDKGRGPVGTVLIQNGQLKVGDIFVCGYGYGRVRAIYDDLGKRISQGKLSQPVQIVGFNMIPSAGDRFQVVESEAIARQIANKRMQLKRERDFRMKNKLTLENLYEKIKTGEMKELNLLIKADTNGSIEAIADSLQKLSNSEVKINIVHQGIGGINEADIMLAAASDAIIIGFYVRPTASIKDMATKENVSIRSYEIIYDVINDVEASLKGMLSPIFEEVIVGEMEVRDSFHIPKVGTVAGCYVRTGSIKRNNKIRIIRDGIVIHQGGLGSLKRFKEDVREVGTGYECGLKIEGFNDIKVGDTIEQFEKREIKR